MRVLSLHPVATELLFALGAGNMLVGRTDECNYPEGCLNVPSIGKTDEMTLDAVAIFEPDLVLIGPDQDYGGAIKTVQVAPKSIRELYDIMQELGSLLGKQVEADMHIHELQSVLERVQLKTAKFHLVKAHLDGNPPEYVLELVRIAGGEPHAGEDVEEFDPQYLIANDEQRLQIISARHPQLRAVQCERMYAIDASLLRPTPRILAGAKMLAKILHGVEVNGNGS